MKKLYIIILLVISVSCTKETVSSSYQVISKVPDLTMPGNKLKFKAIEDYKNYRIVATHFRTDKKEIRYILANETAFKAYNEGTDLPNGSKVVKIGWSAKEMSNFNPALETDEVQRIEYMIKDDKRFSKNPGNWGYARFVKENGQYKSWDKGTASCIACHNLAKDNGYLFTKMQKLQ